MRRWLNQSTHSRMASSRSSSLRHGTQRCERLEAKAALDVVGNTNPQVGSEHRKSFLANAAGRQHR